MKIFLSYVCLGIIALCANCTTGQQPELPPTSQPLRNPALRQEPAQPAQPARSIRAQNRVNPNQFAVPNATLPTAPAALNNRLPQAPIATLGSFPGPHGPGMHNELQKAINELKSAESDDDKSAAKDKIKEELENQYEKFLERDQERVDQLFDRLKKLEEQLERRREAKSRLVELKLEMLISQAEGLGWPGDRNQFGNSNFGVIYPSPNANVLPGPSAPTLNPLNRVETVPRANPARVNPTRSNNIRRRPDSNRLK